MSAYPSSSQLCPVSRKSGRKNYNGSLTALSPFYGLTTATRQEEELSQAGNGQALTAARWSCIDHVVVHEATRAAGKFIFYQQIQFGRIDTHHSLTRYSPGFNFSSDRSQQRATRGHAMRFGNAVRITSKRLIRDKRQRHQQYGPGDPPRDEYQSRFQNNCDGGVHTVRLRTGTTPGLTCQDERLTLSGQKTTIGMPLRATHTAAQQDKPHQWIIRPSPPRRTRGSVPRGCPAAPNRWSAPRCGTCGCRTGRPAPLRHTRATPGA